MNSDCGMIGYEFDGAKRVHGYRISNSINEEFFMECRNFTKSWSGIMGALITKRNKTDTYEAHLIFAQGMIYDIIDGEYKVCFHCLKPGIAYKSIIQNYNNDEFIRTSLYLQECKPVKTTKIIYVNVLLDNKVTNYEPIESNMFTPDHLYFRYDPRMNYIKLKSEKKW